MVWDRNNYLLEAERQLKDEEIYRSVTFNEKLIEVLTEYSNKMLKDLKREGHLFEKQLNCYRFKYRKKCNVGKFYLPLKIHKRLYNVTGRLVFSSYGTPHRKHEHFLIIISNLSRRVFSLVLGIQEIL